ncbi:hypothetical protein CCGE525_03590 [Rhizobium jaguaris]|uniref:Uncharacterized protein n=1 Tax=Rhizobium jaguaris TaxID=1312183 RepID=A0A387FHL4_9HYPH|nr:hypothetical protein CCGE525_03590 [Rhizobium jaguaris]
MYKITRGVFKSTLYGLPPMRCYWFGHKAGNYFEGLLIAAANWKIFARGYLSSFVQRCPPSGAEGWKRLVLCSLSAMRTTFSLRAVIMAERA